MNERQAIKLLKQGDPGGLEFLVRKYQLVSMRAAYLIVRDRLAAEDIVQAAFLRVYERIQQFDGQRRFRPWFLRIVVNDAVKYVTRGKRPISLNGDAAQWDILLRDKLADPFPGPEAQAETQDRRRKLSDAMAELPAEQRAAVVMHYFLDFSVAEISQNTESSTGTVKWRLHAARNRLRQILRSTEAD